MQKWLENAHRHDVQENATHVVTMPPVVMPMFVSIAVSFIRRGVS